MEATLEMPAHSPQIFRITTDNARELAAKSHESRRAKLKLLQEQAEAGRNATPQSERIAEQIKRIEEMLNDATDPDELATLTMAHSRLFSTWQVLTGTPNPGSRKSNRREKPAQPLQPIETPQETPQGNMREIKEISGNGQNIEPVCDPFSDVPPC
jgi:hypothetical protein